MPANLKELRGKIKNVRSTQQITKAMKLVSAAKFGRAQQAVMQSRPYYQGLAGIVGRLSSIPGVAQHPLVQPKSSNEVLLFVVSSQRGLCGGYNANVAKEAMAQIEKLEAAGLRPTVFCLGRKAYQLLSSRLISKKSKVTGRNVIEQSSFESLLESEADELFDSMAQFSGALNLLNIPFEKPSIELGRQLGEFFRLLFVNEFVCSVQMVFNKFGSAITQTPTTLDLLPMRPAGSATGGEATDYVFEPNAETLVSVALPRFLDVQVLQVLKEAIASEHGARMTAMDNATRNGKDMERKYQIRYQRARQAAITTELVEIISGAEAL